VSKNVAVCTTVLFLGLTLWSPSGHAEETTTSAPEIATSVSEEEGPEHGKINAPDASPVDPGHYEIESSFAYGFASHLWSNGGDDHGRGFTSEHSLGLSMTAGIIHNLDVSISSNYAWLKDKENDFDDDGVAGPETGNDFGDLDISGRYRFFQSEAHSLDLAYIGSLTIPTGSPSDQNELGSSQEYWSFNQTLVASKDWGKWTANTDIGYALPFGGKRSESRGTLNADFASGYQVLSWLQPEMELNYSHDFLADECDSDVIAITAGLVMPIHEAIRINTGLQQGIWGRNADKATTFSLALKLAF